MESSAPYWVDLALFWFLGALTPFAIKSLFTTWKKRSVRLKEEEKERDLRGYLAYNGEGELSLKTLLELVRYGNIVPLRTIEITTYGRGAGGLLSPQLTFCGDYKLIQKEPGHYSNWFVVFCHDDEKEKYCRDCAEHVVHRNPFEFRGEYPKELPRGVLNN